MIEAEEQEAIAPMQKEAEDNYEVRANQQEHVNSTVILGIQQADSTA